MVLTQLAPEWFRGFDVALELAFAVVSLIVAVFAFRIYKKTATRTVKFFGISFLLIGISYVMQSLLNFLIITSLNLDINRIILERGIIASEELGLLIHVFFMTLGLSILAYTIFKSENLSVLWLIISLSMFAVFASINSLNMFYIITTILLMFITWHFIKNYLENRHPNTLMITIAFLFLLFGSFHFLISVDHQLFYAIGHILELFAYILIMVNFYLVRK